MVKCFPRGDANCEFEHPDDRLLPLIGTMEEGNRQVGGASGPQGLKGN
jgi:hypothetical protein